MTRKPRAALKMSQELASTVESEVVSGQLRPGDRLPSEAIMGTRHRVSRTVVREAMQTLSARGLIETRKGSGSYVAEQKRTALTDSLKMYSALIKDERMFLELLELRMAVESSTARRAAQKWNAKKERAMEPILSSMEENLGDVTALAALDLEFHLEISRASEHGLFIEILGALLPQIGRRFMENTYVPDEPGLAQRVMKEHRAIFDALVARNPAGAEEAMKAHLSRTLEHFEEMLQDGRLFRTRRKAAPRE